MALKNRRRVSVAVKNMDNLLSLKLYQAAIAEFLGTMLLVIFGCGSTLTVSEDLAPEVISIAIAFGLAISTMIWCFGHVSGAHINPAVSVAMVITRKISVTRCLFYIASQLLGSWAGAGFLHGVTPTNKTGTLGVTELSPDVGVMQGIGVELTATFLLVLCIFASCDSRRVDHKQHSPALMIGMVVALEIPWAVQYTGASMNTARSFGPAVVTGIWKNHWVYWVGPIGGGVIAGLLYEYLFAMNASLTKIRACALSSDYDDEKYQAKKIRVRIIEEDPEDDPDRHLTDSGEKAPLALHGLKSEELSNC